MIFIAARAPALTRAGTILIFVLSAIAVLGIAGCGGGQATAYQPPLEGTVAWTDGTPTSQLEGATIEFEAGGKTVAQAGIRPDGSFMLEKPIPAGDYRVRVLPPPADYNLPNVLDPRFQDFEKSGLTFTATDSGPQLPAFTLAKRRR